MTDSEDFEIEYLDEDEDVVQQCVQASEDGVSSVLVAPLSTVPASSKHIVEPSVLQPSTGSLLVERTPVNRPHKRKKPRKDEDSDSDYDPTDDIVVTSQRRNRKRMQTSTPRPTPTARPIATQRPIPTLERKPKVAHTMSKAEELKYRKSLDLKIPNFEDPLCLPVKAILKDDGHMKKLKNWNNLCLNQYRNHDTIFKPDSGDTVGSQRTIVLRNVKNKLTGKTETTIWGKLTVQSATDKKSDVFQSVLPNYREAKVLDFPVLLSQNLKKSKIVRNVEAVVLTKEDDKGDVLVVYKPKDALSAVYRLTEEQNEEAGEAKKEEEKKQCLRELTVCKVCAPCYQGSWRGFKKNNDKKKSVLCSICKRTFVSVYNLLAHVKTHSPEDVRKHKRQLSKALANVVDYHYKCRICHHTSASIKELRKHVLTHQSTEQFQCEVCNQVIKSS